MTLEEAKGILSLLYIEQLNKSADCAAAFAFEKANFYDDRCKAIDTVLKALEDSIIKDEIRKKIEQLEFLRDDAIEDNFLGDARNLKERIDILQELLGEE